MSSNRGHLINTLFRVFLVLFVSGQLLDFMTSFFLLHAYSGTAKAEVLRGQIPWTTWSLQFFAHLCLAGLWIVHKKSAEKARPTASRAPAFAWMTLVGLIGIVRCISGPREVLLDALSFVDLLALDILGVVGMLLIVWLAASDEGNQELRMAAGGALVALTIGCVQVALGQRSVPGLTLSGTAFIFIAVLRSASALELYARARGERGERGQSADL